MTRVLVVWEDEYWQALESLMKRLVRAATPAPDAEIPAALFHTARSNGGFERYAGKTWPRIRSSGLPADPGMIDHLICVVDGDHLHDLLPGKVVHPPNDAIAVAAWHTAAEQRWQDHLRAKCDPGGPPSTTVHGIVLRWAKESLLLAGYDQSAMEAHLDVSTEHPDVAAALSRCTPRPPQGTADALFTDTFRHPSRCLDILRKACGRSALHKSSPEIDDALRALACESLTTLRARVPDIGRIAGLVWDLHRGLPAAPATPGAAPADRKGRKKQPPAKR